MASTIHDLVEEFYRVCYHERKELATQKASDLMVVYNENIPKDMIVQGGKSSGDWVEWQLIKRKAEIDQRFADFEAEIAVKLPESFKYWHSSYYTLDGDLGFVRLPAIPSNIPFAPLRYEMFEMYLPRKHREEGFLPFGSDGNDAGPLCFHTQAKVENADWPIYLWDHGYPQAGMQLYFSSFRKLLEFVVHLKRGHLPDYADLASGFDGLSVIDPEGAGKFFRRS